MLKNDSLMMHDTEPLYARPSHARISSRCAAIAEIAQSKVYRMTIAADVEMWKYSRPPLWAHGREYSNLG
jgi:hypothetical protein